MALGLGLESRFGFFLFDPGTVRVEVVVRVRARGRVGVAVKVGVRVRVRIRVGYVRLYENGGLWESKRGGSNGRLDALAR